MASDNKTEQKTPKRCHWCKGDDLYQRYHDDEWGVPTRDNIALFELLNLEGMQAGLSWLTILKKRAHMVDTFYQFDPERLAECGERDLKRWLQDAGVIRHRGKLGAIITNAQAYLKMPEDFSEFVWAFVGGAPKQNEFHSKSDVPSETAVSGEMSKTLKKQGFKFVGPTICYAFMQSAGLVNDHVQDCYRYKECKKLG